MNNEVNKTQPTAKPYISPRQNIANWKAAQLAAGLRLIHHDKSIDTAQRDIKDVMLANYFMLNESQRYYRDQVEDLRGMGCYVSLYMLIDYSVGKRTTIQYHVMHYLSNYWKIDFVDMLLLGRKLRAEGWKAKVNWRKPVGMRKVSGTGKNIIVARAV